MAKAWWETRCDKHGSYSRGSFDRRIAVSAPETKAKGLTGCPRCRKEELAQRSKDENNKKEV